MSHATKLTLAVVALAVAAWSGIVVGRLSVDHPLAAATTQPIVLVQTASVEPPPDKPLNDSRFGLKVLPVVEETPDAVKVTTTPKPTPKAHTANKNSGAPTGADALRSLIPQKVKSLIRNLKPETSANDFWNPKSNMFKSNGTTKRGQHKDHWPFDDR